MCNRICSDRDSDLFGRRVFICGVCFIIRRAVKPVYIAMVFDSIFGSTLGISILIILLQENNTQLSFIVMRIYPHCTLSKES